MEWSDWSEEQRRAISRHEGNTLVSASAGSGKTAVVVEHVVRLITGTLEDADLPPVPVRRMLLLTFNNAVGEELRGKIHAELLKRVNGENAAHVRDQLYDLPFADIGTLHGYCKKLISEFFDVLGLDPAFNVADEEEKNRLFDRCTEDVLSKASEEGDVKVYELAEFLGGREALKENIRAFYDRACADHNGLDKLQNEWMREYYLPLDKSNSVRFFIEKFRSVCKQALEGISELEKRLKGKLDRHRESLLADAAMIRAMRKVKTYDDMHALNVSFPAAPRINKEEKEADTGELLEAYKYLRDGYKKELTERAAMFAHSKAEERARMDSAREFVLTLTRLTLDVAAGYAEEKSRENKLDFDDLQQYACKLLDDPAIAKTVAQRYDYVCVDEYQDINDVQERLLQALTRKRQNLFMVGDAKQSIYAFRNADTTIFLKKYDKFSAGNGGEAVKLNRNFRSDAGILQFVNEIFGRLMTKNSCGFDYEKDGKFIVEGEVKPAVRLALFEKDKKEVFPFEFKDGYSVRADAERLRAAASKAEACYIADRINYLVENVKIKRKDGKVTPVNYGDIVLLARTTKGGVPEILETLRNLGIPLDAGGLTRENSNIYIDRLVDLLRVTDNFRQDIPLASALVQFGGFDFSECAAIRRCGGDKLWQAVRACAAGEGALSERVKKFVDMVARYREMSAYMRVSELARRVIAENDYDAVVRSAEGGEKALSQLNAFLGFLTGKQFDRSLSAFLSVMDTGVKTNAASEGENAVRTCTVHMSKGLEFPVVFLIDSAAPPRHAAEGNILFDHKAGIAAKSADKVDRSRSDTLYYLSLKEHKKAEQQREGLRLLYVALTRARNLLYVTGTDGGRWQGSFMWAISEALAKDEELREKYWEEKVSVAHLTDEQAPPPPSFVSGTEHEELSAYLDAPYRYEGSSKTGIKYSVSAINKEPGATEFYGGAELFGEESSTVGSAYHHVLARIDLELKDAEQVKSAIEELVRSGKLSRADAKLVDERVIARCLNSEIMAAARANRHMRERRFTLYLPASEVLPNALTDEKVLVQGALDLMIFGADTGGENILVDFKYTKRSAEEVKKTYFRQLELYALAMEECAGVRPDKRLLYLLGRDEVVDLSVST